MSVPASPRLALPVPFRSSFFFSRVLRLSLGEHIPPHPPLFLPSSFQGRIGVERSFFSLGSRKKKKKASLSPSLPSFLSREEAGEKGEGKARGSLSNRVTAPLSPKKGEKKNHRTFLCHFEWGQRKRDGRRRRTIRNFLRGLVEGKALSFLPSACVERTRRKDQNRYWMPQKARREERKMGRCEEDLDRKKESWGPLGIQIFEKGRRRKRKSRKLKKGEEKARSKAIFQWISFFLEFISNVAKTAGCKKLRQEISGKIPSLNRYHVQSAIRYIYPSSIHVSPTARH